MRDICHPVKSPIRQLEAAAAQRCGVSVAELRGKTRTRRVALARKAVYLAARRLTCQPSYPEIGSAMGRDHTSVMYGVRSARALEVSSPWFASLMHDLAQLDSVERPVVIRYRVAS